MEGHDTSLVLDLLLDLDENSDALPVEHTGNTGLLEQKKLQLVFLYEITQFY
jgi:hypothetical protein